MAAGFGWVQSTAIRAGDFVFVSGVVAIDPESGERLNGTLTSEAHRAFGNLKLVLEAAGSSLERVVKLNVLLYDMLEFENMNAFYKQFFPVDPPARTTCGVQLSAGMKIEIECIALAG